MGQSWVYLNTDRRILDKGSRSGLRGDELLLLCERKKEDKEEYSHWQIYPFNSRTLKVFGLIVSLSYETEEKIIAWA